MNILFFLKPKMDIIYIKDTYTLRQTMELMEYHRYSMVPMIDEEGHYIGTISEGDILWYIKNNELLNIYDTEKIKISDLKRNRDNQPININESIESLINKAKNENFIPVIDDRNLFIGIITRQDIINYFLTTQIRGSNEEK